MNGVALHRGISVHRINAMVLRYWYLLMSSWPRLLELIYWPALQIITWGFLQNYISQTSGFFAHAGGSIRWPHPACCHTAHASGAVPIPARLRAHASRRVCNDEPAN